MNKLKSLINITNIVADTANIETIKFYKLNDITTNPSLILQSINTPEYKKIINKSIISAKKEINAYSNLLENIYDHLIVNIGIKILKIITGRISIEIDARLSYNTNKTIQKAKRIIELYNKYGIKNNRILIKIAATWQGIKAAEKLEKNEINCNLTLLFSLTQAKACAEAGIYLISPFVGRIKDWYRKNNILISDISEHPGINFVKKIFYYYKQHGYKTIVMGASFRDTDEILELAGCDSLTISPQLLQKLSMLYGTIETKLHSKINTKITNNPISKNIFLKQINANKMAYEELKKGINNFIIAQKAIENYIINYTNY